MSDWQLKDGEGMKKTEEKNIHKFAEIELNRLPVNRDE